MPVSHLGLTVGDISSATSFYLSALQPLGYRYFGQQGDSIGLGVDDADFFLCHAKNGTRVSPTHIAFAANNRVTVRDCYAAALNAGGHPSGSPGYRNNDCSCFNAAVEDLDGNTIEFILREPSQPTNTKRIAAHSEKGTIQTRSNDTARGGSRNEGQSFAAFASKTQSIAQTALDLTSSASKSLRKSDAPASGIHRSKTEPIGSTNGNGNNAFVGTLLGAAAGAAFAYAMTQSERDNAREEAAFGSSMRPEEGRSRGLSDRSGRSKSSRRTNEDANTARYLGYMRTIEAPTYDDDDVQKVFNRHKPSSRPKPQRSKTYDAVEYAPKPTSSSRGDRFSMKRASTLPLDVEQLYIEAPRTSTTSRHRSRRGSLDDAELERHDSGVSMNSHRSRRSSRGKASTAKPPRRSSWHDSAANVPLPRSRSTSHATDNKFAPRGFKARSYVTAAQVPLPQSRATSYISTAQIWIPSSNAQGWYPDTGEESDGLGDMASVVPDDSISCVDFSKPTKKSKASSRASKRSEADSDRTIRPSKQSSSRHSAKTVPTRRKEDSYSQRSGKRSTATYT